MIALVSCRTSTLAVLLVLSASVTGCGSSSRPTATVVVRSVDLPGPGQVLVDGAGQVLYIYTPDNRGSSRCTAACASEWPPLLLPAGVRHATPGHGVHASLLGTTRRPGGALQVTYNDWPLYRYVSDAPGEATGQGGGMGAWYLLSPDGTVARQIVTSSGT